MRHYLKKGVDMKRRNIIIGVIGIVIIVLSGICFITRPNVLASMNHSYSQPETGISNVTFNAMAGDEIKISFESDIENGELDIILYDSQHNAVYQLDHAASLSIPFTVERADTYTMAAEYIDFVGNFKLKIRKP